MSAMSLSTHARVRMQQRGITAQAIAMLLEVGRAGSAGGGREIVFLDKQEQRRLSRIEPLPVRGRDRLAGLYAITDAHGTVVTVGHRYRRLARAAR